MPRQNKIVLIEIVIESVFSILSILIKMIQPNQPPVYPGPEQEVVSVPPPPDCRVAWSVTIINIIVNLTLNKE